MSPELMRNERYDFHVDMWALGCICFELCSLDLPFAAASLLQLAMQVMDSEPAWDKLEGRSEQLIYVNHWLLQKDVKNRPTASRVLEESLFAEGGAADVGPSEEEWLSLSVPEMFSSTEKRRAQMMTASTAALSGSDTHSWMTTAHHGEYSPPSDTASVSVTGMEASATNSYSFMQQSRDERRTVMDELAQLMNTQQRTLIEQLKEVHRSGSLGNGESYETCSQPSTSCGPDTPVPGEYIPGSNAAETVM